MKAVNIEGCLKNLLKELERKYDFVQLEFQISSTQINVIRAISELPSPVPLSSIEDFTGLNKSVLSRSLTDLFNRKIIGDQLVIPSDRRCKYIGIIDKDQFYSMVTAIRKIDDEIAQIFIKELGNDRVSQAIDTLVRMTMLIS